MVRKCRVDYDIDLATNQVQQCQHLADGLGRIGRIKKTV